jgi:large subunit ribosomal protein L33
MGHGLCAIGNEVQPTAHGSKPTAHPRAAAVLEAQLRAAGMLLVTCSETGDLNYRTPVNVKGSIPEKLKAGLKKYSPRLRRHTVHKIKRK